MKPPAARQTRYFLPGIFLLTGGILTLHFRSVVDLFAGQLASRFLSADGIISPANLEQLKDGTRLFSVLLCISGLILLIFKPSQITSALHTAWNTITTEPFSPEDRNDPSRYVFWGSSLVSLFIVLMAVLEGKLSLQHLYGEDRFFEYATFSLFLISSVLMARAAAGLRKSHLSIAEERGIRAFFYVLALLLFLFALEEVSYGQRIIRWETPARFQTINRQGETNLHNLLNDQFETLYPLLSFCLFPYLVSFILRTRSNITTTADLILPHPANLVPALFIACFAISAGFNRQELLEQLLSVLAIFHAIRSVAAVHTYSGFSSNTTILQDKS